MSKTYYIGVDISKDEIVAVAYPQSHRKAQTFSRDSKGIEEFVEWARKRKPRIVIMEATGGLERPVALELATAELPLRVVNPSQASRFAEAIGFEKSDQIDAYRLGHMAQALELQPEAYFSENQLEMKELIARRQQLVKFQTKEKNRLRQARSSFAKDDLQDSLKTIKAKIKSLDRKVDELMDEEDEKSQDSDDKPNLAQKRAIIESIPGVGKTTARILLAQMPELGELNKGEVAALAGLAPYRNQSGKTEGSRRTGKGRTFVKELLYMCVVTAIRWNPVIKKKYDGLVASGKSKKVALTACMRKLIIRINAMVRNGSLWDATHRSIRPPLLSS